MRNFVTVLSVALLALPLGAAAIDVQVSAANGTPVQDAVVYAVPASPIPVGHKVATMDQKNRMFVPHILPIQTGTWVEFPNSDNIRHQVYSLSPAKRFQLPLYTGKPAYPLQFTNPGVVLLGCNIHDQMSAYIVAVDTPYFAKTDAGRVTLRDVGAGQYTVHVWAAGLRDEPKPISVMLGGSDHPAVSFVLPGK
jgi:plastocyanin